MDFELTTEQSMFKDMAKEFAIREIQPYVKQWDRDCHTPPELFVKMGEIGLLGVNAPEEYGGLDLGWLTLGIVTEELAFYDMQTALSGFSRNSLGMLPLIQTGSEEQKKKYLPGLVAGTICHCMGVVEPNAGSDAIAIETTAILDGDEYVINGNKTWITNACHSDFAMVVCQTDKTKGTKGLAVMVVDAGTPGFTRAPIENKLGYRHHDHGQLFFRDCRVPKDNQLGGFGIHFGMRAALSNVEHTRYGIAIGAVGALKSCLDLSVNYCKERVQFKKPIASFQLVQDKIGDMVIAHQASQLLAYKLGYMKDKGLDVTRESSVAKYHNMEALKRCSAMAVELHGAYGLSDEYPVERIYRDCMAPYIYGGTAHVHKLVLGRLETGINAVAR